MAISDYITHTVVVIAQPQTAADEHRSGWWSGYDGQPTVVGATKLWLDAFAQGSKCRSEGQLGAF